MKKKILLVVAVGIVVAAGLFARSYFHHREIVATAERLFPAVLEGNAQMFWEASTEKFKAALLKNYGSKEEFFAEMERAKEQYSDIRSWRIGKYIDSKHEIAIPMIMQYSDGYEQQFYLYLKPIEGEWQLSGARLKE